MFEIITPATSKLLTTPEAVRADLKVANDADNGTLLPLIAQASSVIEGWCGRSLALVTARETFRLRRHSPDIHLSGYPVAEIIGVTVAGTVLASEGYEVDRASGAVYRLSKSGRYECWPAGIVAIEYSAGYVLPPSGERTLPADLERAAISLTARFWYARGRDMAVKAADYGDVSLTYGLGSAINGDGLPADIAALVSHHRCPVMG